MSVQVTGSTTALQLAQAVIAAAGTTTSTAAPTTTLPMGPSKGTAAPAGYVLHTGINPDIRNGPGRQQDPNTKEFYVRRNEKGQNLPAPGPSATSGGANGWTVVILNPQGQPAGTVFKTKVVSHVAAGNLWDGSPGPFDKFKFSPAPGDFGHPTHTYGYYFAPTATGGRRRRGSRSRKSRKGRKGTRRH
jgi:hypothetical protein